MTLELPVQARCANRSQVTRAPRGGGPDDWWHRDWLEARGLTRATFDFFVDWRKRRLAKVAWSKVSASGPSADRVRQSDDALAQPALDVVDTVTNRLAVQAMGMSHTVRLLPEPFNPPDGIGVVEAVGSERLAFRSLEGLRDEIALHSGGRFRIGRKGLTYGTSEVECYLSTTDTPWPGDVDAIIFDAESLAPVCVLEWKKHNPQFAGRIADNLFDHYYRRGDQRKWDRLAILARSLDVPLGVVYFASDASEPCIIQRISGADGDLHVVVRDEASHPVQLGGSPDALWRAVTRCTGTEWPVGLAAEHRARYDT